ncbi:MAG: FlgD immunoglobulin-like domain containing protein, partial [Bacteroidota bacterium]
LGTGYHAYYDLTYDGEFLWATDRTQLVQIDPASGALTGETIPTDFTPYLVQGVTYDPATDRFWVIPQRNAQQQILYQIDREGNRLRSFAPPPGDAVTSLAWDAVSPGGPSLWLFVRQSIGYNTRGVFRQFSPALGALTGVEFEMVNRSAIAVDGPRGSAFTTDLVPGTPTLVSLQAGELEPRDGLDWVVAYTADLASDPQSAGIAVDPPSLAATVTQEETITVPVTITNTGSVDLTWEATVVRADDAPASGARGDVLSTLDVRAAIDDSTLVVNSMTVARGQIWISGRTATDRGRLYQIDPDGTLVGSYLAGGVRRGGWLSITTDGDRIYGSDTYSIAVWDIDSTRVVDQVVTGSISPTGLAYDRDNGHFYLGAGASGAIEVIDREGDTVRLLVTPYDVRGLAWDDLSPGGPYLWAWVDTETQTTCRCEAIRLDPTTGLPTGATFTGQGQGGEPSTPEAASISRDLVPGAYAFVGLQETGWPERRADVVAHDLAVALPPDWLDLVGPTRGTVAASGVDTLTVAFHGTMADTTTTARIRLQSNDPMQPVLEIPVALAMRGTTPVSTEAPDAARGLALLPNAPNPFGRETALRLSLPEAAPVTLDVLDARGRRVARLVDRQMLSGTHAVVWDGTQSDGTPAASGVYLAVLTADGETVTQRMLLAR